MTLTRHGATLSRTTPLLVGLLLAMLSAAACGGSSSNPATPTPTPAPTPTPTPTPTPVPPGAFVCGAIGGFLGAPQGIINGLVCSAATSPVVLVLLEDATGKVTKYCSGTVIASNAVLTAAHCLSTDIKRVEIELGGLGGKRIVASSFAPIPDYNADVPLSPDVGVVIVGQSLGRTPLPLLVSRDGAIGEQGVVAGYGIDATGNQSQGILRAGTVTILRTIGNFIISDFSGDVSNVCSGDSGGPLLLQQAGTWSIAGVTSAGESGDCLSGISDYARLRNDTIAAFVFGLVPGAGRQ